jgi:hypothetical protein
VITQLEGGRWWSSLTGSSYDSESAARHFEAISRRRGIASVDALGGLTPEQIAALQADVLPAAEPEMFESGAVEGLFANYPRVKRERSNLAAILVWCKLNGISKPFTLRDVINATESLLEVQGLQLHAKGKR